MRIQEQQADVVILGAGGGGYPAAFLLARAGLRVVMVDPIGNLGGTAWRRGAYPRKPYARPRSYVPEQRNTGYSG